MPRNPYSSFDIEGWFESSQQTATTDEGLFDIDEWMRQAEEAQRKQEEEQERLAQERAELEKQRKEELVKATQVAEEELDFDSVLDSIIQAENPDRDPNAVYEGKKGYDYGMLQMNERWVNKGLTASGLPSFAINPETGDSDRVYIEIQDFMATKVPNWNMMSDEFRRQSLLNQENNIEVGRILYNRRGLDQWSTSDKVRDSLKTKKRIEHTGDLAQKALSGEVPSLDDISVSFSGKSLPADVDPDQSLALQRNRDRKKRLEKAERPKDWLDAFAEVAETPSNIVPFLQTQNEMQELAEINAHIDTIKKADEGGYDPPPESIFKVHEWQTQNQAETSRGYDIWNTVFGSIPFAGELYSTGGVFTVGKKTAVKGLKEGLKWGLGKKGRDLVGKYAVKNGLVKKSGELALKSTAAIGASGVQTLAIEAVPEAQRLFTGVGGGRIRTQTVMNMMDRVGIQESEQGDLEAVLFEEGDDFWDAFSKGAANVFIENLSEQSGLLFSKIPAGAKGMLIRQGILEKFLTKNKGATVGQFRSILRRAGWNGVIGEIVEERAGDVARSITYNVAGVGDETWELPTLEELGDRLLTEFPAFMIPGGAFGAVSAALSRDRSDLTKPTNALKFLNKANYKLKVVKNDKTGKYDMQVLINDNVEMVESFDSKKEARDNLKTYAVEEAGNLKEFFISQAEKEITAPEERQVFPEENKQGQAYVSKISEMSPEDLEKEQAKVSTLLDKAKTDRQKTYRQRQLSALEDVMAPAEEVVEPVAEEPVVEEPEVEEIEEEVPVEEVEEVPALTAYEQELTRNKTTLEEAKASHNKLYAEELKAGEITQEEVDSYAKTAYDIGQEELKNFKKNPLKALEEDLESWREYEKTQGKKFPDNIAPLEAAIAELKQEAPAVEPVVEEAPTVTPDIKQQDLDTRVNTEVSEEESNTINVVDIRERRPGRKDNTLPWAKKLKFDTIDNLVKSAKILQKKLDNISPDSENVQEIESAIDEIQQIFTNRNLELNLDNFNIEDLGADEVAPAEEAPAEAGLLPQLEQSLIRKYGKNYENNPAFQEYLDENDLVDIRELDEEGQQDLHSDLSVRDIDSGFDAGFLGVTPQNLKLLGDTIIGAGRFTFQTLPKFVQKQGKALGVTTDNFKQKWDEYSADPGKAPQKLKAYMKKVFTHMKQWYGKSKEYVVEYLKSPKIGLGLEVVGGAAQEIRKIPKKTLNDVVDYIKEGIAVGMAHPERSDEINQILTGEDIGYGWSPKDADKSDVVLDKKLRKLFPNTTVRKNVVDYIERTLISDKELAELNAYSVSDFLPQAIEDMAERQKMAKMTQKELAAYKAEKKRDKMKGVPRKAPTVGAKAKLDPSILFEPVPVKYYRNKQGIISISTKSLTGANQKQAASIYNWMWEFGTSKSDFVKAWSRAASEKQRGGLSRRQYEIQVLSPLHSIAKEKFIADVKSRHKKAQDKFGLLQTFDSGKHMMDWYDNFYDYMVEKFGSEADLAIDFIAITSAGVDLHSNIGYGLKAYAQYKLNDKLDTGLYPATLLDNLQNAIDNHRNRNNPKYTPKKIGGMKVTNFSQALRKDENAVVLDLWMAREFGLWKVATSDNVKATKPKPSDPSKEIKGTAVWIYDKKGNGFKATVVGVGKRKAEVEWGGGRGKPKNRKSFSYKEMAVIKDTFTDAEYVQYEQVVKELAERRGVTPRQMQAGIWFGIREGHSPMHPGQPHLESAYFEDLLTMRMRGHTNKKGEKIAPWTYKGYNVNQLKELSPDILDALNTFSSFPSPAQMDLVKTMLIDAGRFTYDNLTPAMQKLGNKLGINSKNFKMRFTQFANNARNMTESSKKWFKKVMNHMKAWFKKMGKKLIESKPMQQAYKRIEDIVVKRIVPEGDIPDMAPAKSEESPKERRSVIMDLIEENNGLPPKINPYKKSKLALMFYDKVLVPISTRLARIHPQLKRIIRKYHENADINTGRDMLNVEAFLTKMEKLDKVERDKLDLAMINGWGEEIDALIKKHGIEEEYNKVREVLDGIYDRAVGLDEVQYQRYRQLKDFILPDLKNTPQKAWKKEEIMAWLDRQGVKYSKASTKAQLLVNAEKKAKSEAAKYKNLKEEFNDLDRQVIYDIPYYKHYHPREILSYDKLLEHIIGAKLEGDLDIALNDRARSLGVSIEDLTDQQRVDTINMFFRNTTGAVAKTPKNVKKRKFIELDTEMSTYYKDSSSALISYISRMNEAIARAQLFGKGTGVVGANIENLNDKDVGAFIDGMRMSQDPKNPIITTENEGEIKEIFSAKFSSNYGKDKGGIQALKNLVYIGTIGDYMSTLTQLGDLGFAGYRSVMAGHPIVFLKTLYKGFISGDLKIKAKDIGMDRIAAEFSRDQATFSATLGKIFKKSGFAKLDRIGKEVLVNSTIETMRVQANSKKGLSKKNMGIINAAFGEGTKEAKDVVEQIKAGEVNQNVISLAYWVLLDHQPVAESELPAKYLESESWKLAYQLKTWAIKVLDVYRNEVYDTMFKKKQYVTGAINMLQLSTALLMANVGADWLKGFILGKPIRLTDQAFDNLLKMVFLSKYTFSKRQLKPGNSQVIRGLAGNAVPLLALADDVLSDAYTVSKWFTVGLNDNESLRYDLKFPSRIPFVGRLIFHRGGLQGRERVLNREKKYYTELNKERDLNKTESYDFGIVLDQLAKIELIKTQGIKGGYLYKALGIGEEDATLGL